MKSGYAFAIFLAFFSLSFIGLHLYCHSFISRRISDYRNLRALFLFMAFFPVFTMFIRRVFEGDITKFLSLIGFFWMGAVLIMAFVFLSADLIMFFFRNLSVSARIPYISLIVIFFLWAISIYNALKTPDIKKIEIDGFSGKSVKIVFLSDVHADFKFRKKLFFSCLDKAMRENPDFLVLGGDLLDPGFEMSEKEFEYLRNLKIKKIAVLGNHEYYYGIERTMKVYEKAGFKLLIDSSFDYGGINFIGLSDLRTAGLRADDLIKIVSRNMKKGAVNIVLSHQPLYFNELAEKHDVLMLSGHVHKAQIFPFHIFVRPVYKYFYGIYKHGNSILYVTSGSGTWGPPMRLLAGAEIPVITLR